MSATRSRGLTLVIGNKAYSSWSLRGWLTLKLAGLAFDELVIPLDQPETRGEILRHSPSGRVPALVGPELAVWDSLAIACWAVEDAPGLLPEDPVARAWGWSITAEMHSGFRDLRLALPFDLKRPVSRAPALAPTVEADIARVREVWETTLARFGGRGGPFLFGRPGLADAAYAPVVCRFATYGVPLGPPLEAYAAAVRAMPEIEEWTEAALAEPWVLENP